jgi:hypothetical protein
VSAFVNKKKYRQYERFYMPEVVLETVGEGLHYASYFVNFFCAHII